MRCLSLLLAVGVCGPAWAQTPFPDIMSERQAQQQQAQEQPTRMTAPADPVGATEATTHTAPYGSPMMTPLVIVPDIVGLDGLMRPAPQWQTISQSQAGAAAPWVQDRVAGLSRELTDHMEAARAKGQRYVVWVNIPSFMMRVYDATTHTEELSGRVIVGAPHSRTPVFTTTITNLKFNPDWSPPPSLVRKGRRYVPAGPNSPLGEVRFTTDNNQNVYLHDSNTRGLFDQEQRALSAGCVRVKDWHSLSQILGGLSEEQVEGHIDGHRTHFVDTPDAYVWTSYERVDLDEDGVLTLFPDIYQRQALPADGMPPRPSVGVATDTTPEPTTELPSVEDQPQDAPISGDAPHEADEIQSDEAIIEIIPAM